MPVRGTRATAPLYIQAPLLPLHCCRGSAAGRVTRAAPPRPRLPREHAIAAGAPRALLLPYRRRAAPPAGLKVRLKKECGGLSAGTPGGGLRESRLWQGRAARPARGEKRHNCMAGVRLQNEGGAAARAARAAGIDTGRARRRAGRCAPPLEAPAAGCRPARRSGSAGSPGHPRRPQAWPVPPIAGPAGACPRQQPRRPGAHSRGRRG
jgi:hypothetical protein